MKITSATEAKTHIANLITWETTNNFSVRALICELLNWTEDRVSVEHDGTVMLDGVQATDDRHIDLANRLPK